jgi:hypothetical protein
MAADTRSRGQPRRLPRHAHSAGPGHFVDVAGSRHELAVAAGCSHIITHNTRDFRGSERFGIHALTPGEFLTELERHP